MLNKYYIIIAYDGTETIDNTPEAENRLAAMNYQEEKARRERNRRINKQKTARNLLWKLAGLCGLV